MQAETLRQVEHGVVYAQAGRFAGWPANNGLWSWDGREILVGFVVGDFVEQKGHNCVEPYTHLLARSTDGGRSWQIEQPAGLGAPPALPEPTDLAPVNFAEPDLALRVSGAGYHGSEQPRGAFYASRDRGHTWQGPRRLGALADCEPLRGLDLTPRTDYAVEDARGGLFFMAARKPGDWRSEKAFCARTTDGGATFQFVSWIVPQDDPYRAVMPASVRCSPTKLVVAVRRRDMPADRCWIDAYVSTDNAGAWAFLSKVGDTGSQNGNPPALARLSDGRLCCVYGNRDTRQMLVRYSPDEGVMWSAEMALRADFQPDAYGDADFGYPRVAQRADGALIAIYYWATATRPQQHIAATIWNAGDTAPHG